jgi:hypothetical protein
MPVRAEPAVAEVLFDEGVELAANGDLKQACQKFEASESLDVAVGTLLRLGDCYERTGRLASAWSRFREAASLAQAQGMSDRQRIARVRADALSARMARVSLHPPTEPPADLRIVVAGTEVPRASWGSALPVDAGTTLIEASAPGRVPFRREVSIPADDGALVDVTIPALEPVRPEPTQVQVVALRPRAAPARPIDPGHAPQLVDRGYAARATGVTLAVVGGLGLATSGMLSLLAKKRDKSSLEYCPEDERLCSARGVQLRREAIKLADAATVSVAVGGGLLAAGLVVYLAAPKAATEHTSLAFAADVRNGGVTLRAKAEF